MAELLTAAQMRAIETTAIESGEVTGLELMERAGRGVVDAVFTQWPDLAKTTHRAVVLCGPGNNGGDGFVIARLLKHWGWEIDVFLYGDADKLPPDARRNYERWTEIGSVTVRRINPPPLVDDSLDLSAPFDLLVDALFGTGLTRPFGGVFSTLADNRSLLTENGQRVVAVDVPSGLCADSGRVLGTVIPADLTVTFHSRKLGHQLSRGAQLCGVTLVHDIGLPKNTAHTGPAGVVQQVGSPNPKRLGKHMTAHKYAQGHALVLSGPPGAGGAARLAARGALRIGAGLVSVVCPEAAVPEHAAHLTAIMIKTANDAGELATLLNDARFNALCLGPGLGLEQARDLVQVALQSSRATVLDADALTAFAAAPDALFSMLHENCVLTPHAGEFTRLFPDIAAKLDAVPVKGPAYSKVDATRDAANRAGCTVLFKGPDTVIANPSGRCSINAAQDDRAAPWLATAGSGDVLAGFITGLLARGFEPMQAAETAAWLHVDAARSFGPGLIAEDLPEQLPRILSALGV